MKLPTNNYFFAKYLFIWLYIIVAHQNSFLRANYQYNHKININKLIAAQLLLSEIVVEWFVVHIVNCTNLQLDTVKYINQTSYIREFERWIGPLEIYGYNMNYWQQTFNADVAANI